MAILLVVLVLMNTYPLIISQDLVFRSKHTALQNAAAAINASFTGLDELTAENVSSAMSAAETEGVSRAVITDAMGYVLYDTRELGNAAGHYIFYTELVEALRGNNAVYCVYENHAFHSSAAQPVLYRNQIIGGVYVYDYDTEQAALLENLRDTLMRVSIAMSALTLIISAIFGRSLTRRLQNLQEAIIGVREGAYNRRAVLSGHDEYTQIAGEFNALVDRLQETENARRQFVSDASHELKTPLAAIRLLTDSILQNENVDGETVREFVSDIGQEAERLNRITEDLLRLTRLDSGQPEDASLIEVEPVLDRVVRMLRPVADEKEISLLLACGSGASVVTSPGELHQILYNLAENAIKYNRHGGYVSITAAMEDETTTITVDDNGIGIPAEDLSRVFKRFYRVDKARSRDAGGTGLGLAIVNDTVSRRGGAVWAENRPEGGTRFVVKLPCLERGGDQE